MHNSIIKKDALKPLLLHQNIASYMAYTTGYTLHTSWFNTHYITLFIVIAIYAGHYKAVSISRKSGTVELLMLK